MTESKMQYTTPDEVAARLLRMEAYIKQLENTIDGFNMVMGQHRATIAEQTRRIVELEATNARLEQDNRRLRHLDAMPVDALARYWKNSGVPAFGVGYESDEYEADYDAIVGWFNVLGYTDGDA